jgi:CheY-specific phosphatase CheX
MNSQYFAQYLLNTGELPIETIRQLLGRASKRKPQLPVLAMQHGMVTATQIEELGEDSNSKFVAAAIERGLLTKVQVKNLQEAVAGDNLRFAQAMIDKKIISYVEMEKLLKRYSKAKQNPLQEAVNKVADKGLEKEIGYYGEYTELFIHSFARFMGVPTVIEIETMDLREEACPTHMVSQRLSGDLGLVASIVAKDEVFVEMARRYSGEDISRLNELAIDSMEEFLNVINGLYAVNMAKRQMEIDLELPHTVKNMLPAGNLQLMLRIDASIGSFLLVLGSDEFLS